MPRIVFSLLLVFYLSLFTDTDSKAGIWIRKDKVKQGEVVLVSGLFFKDKKQPEIYLEDCFLEFTGKKYPFFLDILNQRSFEGLSERAGFQFVSRIPTDVFTKTGTQEIKLQCSNELKKTYLIEVLAEDFPLQEITLTGNKAYLRTTAAAWQKIRKALASKTERKHWDSSKNWILPNDSRISTPYGVRRKYNGVFAKNYFHKGIDFAGGLGDLIKAPSSGKVILVGRAADGFHAQGNCIFIDHGQGLVSAYYHLLKSRVKAGEFVSQGQVIGEIGSTGISTGPHLHFGLYYHEVNINPTYLFERPFF